MAVIRWLRLEAYIYKGENEEFLNVRMAEMWCMMGRKLDQLFPARGLFLKDGCRHCMSRSCAQTMPPLCRLCLMVSHPVKFV